MYKFKVGDKVKLVNYIDDIDGSWPNRIQELNKAPYYVLTSTSDPNYGYIEAKDPDSAAKTVRPCSVYYKNMELVKPKILILEDE